jgi:putative peptide maturation system protein
LENPAVSIPDIIIGSLPGTELSLSDFLRRLRIDGRLRSLVLTALAEQMVDDEARLAGLSVSPEELQRAADDFRRGHGLCTSADTHAWLAQRGMSAADLNERLAHELLAARLRHHLLAGKVEGHFAAHQGGYERLRLAQVCVGRDDLAHELASQVREDGRELGAVALEHRVPLKRGEWFRKDLASPLSDAVATATNGELIGPVATSEGFVLVLVEERQAAVLDNATRQYIETELFKAWVTERMREARIELATDL